MAGCGKTPAPAPAAPVAPAAKVKAGDLLAEYGANAVAADMKYKGKVIQVSGKFGSAQKAPLYGYAVQLLPEDAGDATTSSVLCIIVEAAKEDVAKMKADQPITMQGTCDGQVVGQIKMTKCTVVK
jgi:hypothetical protein